MWLFPYPRCPCSADTNQTVYIHSEKCTDVQQVYCVAGQGFLSFFPCSCKSFVRWMDGTCIETDPQQREGQDDPEMFTFLSDISQDAAIIQVAQALVTRVNDGLRNANKQLNYWRRFHPLWRSEKVAEETCLSNHLFLSVTLHAN